MKHVPMLLTKLNSMESLGHMFEDNAGAMLLSSNRQASKRIKHIDLKHYLIRELGKNKNGCNQCEIFKI